MVTFFPRFMTNGWCDIFSDSSLRSRSYFLVGGLHSVTSKKAVEKNRGIFLTILFKNKYILIFQGNKIILYYLRNIFVKKLTRFRRWKSTFQLYNIIVLVIIIIYSENFPFFGVEAIVCNKEKEKNIFLLSLYFNSFFYKHM